MKGGYFLLNGRFHKEEDSVFNLADLTRRTEGFSEVFRAEHNEILFHESICSHLLATAWTIGLDLTGSIDREGRLLQKDVSRLLNKNKLYLAAKIKIQIYPSNGHINILLSAAEIGRGFYPVHEPGLLLSFYRDNRQEIQSTSAYSTSGSFVRQAARRNAEELNRPNMILLNKPGNACETIDGSFAYLNSDHVIFTTDCSGGYRCAIKEKVIQSVKEAGFQPQEKDQITPDDLLNAEELFLYDACNGIQKVLGLEERRFFSTKTQLIAGKLSELAKKDREEKITD